LVLRRESKPGAMFLFEGQAARRAPKGKNREGRPIGKLCQEFYRKGFPARTFF